MGGRYFPESPGRACPCSAAHRAVIKAPLFRGASTTSTPCDIPLMMRLRSGNLQASGWAPRGYSEISAALLNNLREKVAVLTRIVHIPDHSPAPQSCARLTQRPRCAAASMPTAPPLTIVIPSPANSRAIRSETLRP